MYRLLAPIAILLSIFVISCKQSREQEKTPDVVVQLPQEKVEAKLHILQDSIKMAWADMHKNDSTKMAYVKRLLEEVSYTPKYDVVAQGKLLKKCLALKEMHLDENAISVSANIDRYDAATDSLLKAVTALVVSTPNVENYPLCGQLMSEITALDNNVVMQRIKHDGFAQQYNQVLTEQKETLQKMGPSFAELKPKSYFSLEQ
jgi:hypothetical protein